MYCDFVKNVFQNILIEDGQYKICKDSAETSTLPIASILDMKFNVTFNLYSSSSQESVVVSVLVG